MKSIGLRRHQRGASILEFIFTLMLFTIIAFTAIEFGGIFTRLNTLTKSVQDATRFLADNSSAQSYTPAQEAIARNLVLYNSVNVGQTVLLGNAGTVTVTDLGNHVQVTVVYNHTPIAGQALNNLIGLFAGGINLTMPLTATSIMRFAQ